MDVLVAFVDDSTQKSSRAGMGTIIALGAVVFPFDQLKPFADAVNARLDVDAIPHEVELKWSTDGKKDWFRVEKMSHLVTPLRKDLLKLALDHGARAVVVAWDVSLQKTLQGRPAASHVIEWLWERVSMLIENRGAIGLIVFDKPGGDNKEEDKWISETIDLTAGGNAYVKANAVVTPFLTAPSHHHRHIQIADLVVGAMASAIGGGKYGMELIPDLLPLMHQNAYKSIGGTGLKLYPDSLINLYHWVLGEDTFWRVGYGSGVVIPWSSGRFTTDDGLDS